MAKRKIGLIIISFIFAIGLFGSGIYIGIKLPAESKIAGLINKEPAFQWGDNTNFATFWQAWDLLQQKFVDREKLDRQKMIYGAISGLYKASGDPYTVFFPPKENRDFQNEIKGSFEGVGMEVGIRKNILTVVAPLKGTPAERAGIKAGDKILKINDTSTNDLSTEEAVGLIKGPRGTIVKLAILRNGDDRARVIEITRDIITIPTIDTETTVSKSNNGSSGSNPKNDQPKDIFVIRLYNFSESSAIKFREAVRKMLEGGQKKLIIDLRNNPGGFLDSAVDIASWFLPQGDVVVTEHFGPGNERVHRSRGYDVLKGIPVVILVNQGSASASEILAGALRDHGIATLVGEKTFGKGSVQELMQLTSDTSLKITIAKWLTPKGNTIAEVGLQPDIEVKVTESNTQKGKDPVMEKALELLNKK